MANDDNQGQVRFRCSHCKRDLPADGPQPCPFCGKTGRDIITLNTETLNIREEKPIAVVETLKRNYPWFLATVIVTMAAPFITAFLNPIVGIAVGLGFGYASFRLGKKAYILIKRIY